MCIEKLSKGLHIMGYSHDGMFSYSCAAKEIDKRHRQLGICGTL